MENKVVIIGAGHAGDAAAAHLRQYGFAGMISVVGDEPFAPYHRPPLSKARLKGELAETALALRAADFYARQNISLRLGTRAARIDRAARHVILGDGDVLPYTHLILATGARARPLQVPGADFPHVHTLRTRTDADRLRAALAPARRLVIIGGGYIGLEIAASARALGVAVTVLEREARLLARVASAPLASFFRHVHEAQGVKFHLGANVAGISPDAVVLHNGESIPANMVLIGVGAIPNTELAQAAGLPCENGVLVDDAAQTSDPAIFAIGDCTARPVPLYGRRLRLESVPNALEQAKQAASAITGRRAPAPEVPWFWSDQYSVRLQIAGLLLDTTETVLRGDPIGEKFAAFHLAADGTLRAVEAVNAPEAFMAGRLMIGRRTIPDNKQLADVTIPLQTIAAG